MKRTNTQYSPHSYSNLKDHDEIRSLAESKAQLMPIIGQILCKHSMENDFGVYLLHRHHTLSQDERLVHEIQNDAWVARPRVIADEDISPIVWGVFNGRLEPLEFVPSSPLYSEEHGMSSKLTSNTDFQEDFIAILEELQLETLFGISLLPSRDEFKKDGFMLFERSDLEARTTKTILVKETPALVAGGTTQWFVTPGDGKSIPVTACAYGSSRCCCGD